MKRVVISIFALAFCAGITNVALATVPDLIPVQGVLADDMDEPVDGPTDITFTLYDDDAGTTTLWTDGFADVDVVDGFFTVYLGSDTALDFGSLISNSEIWLGIEVESDGEMDLIQLAAVPFAIEAGTCQSVGSLTESDINTNFSAAGHDHDADYAAIGHDHDSDYAALSHNHDAAYAPISHNHDATYVNEGQANSITSAMIVDSTITAADLGANSVGTSEVVDNSLTASDLAANSVGTSEVADNSLTAADLLSEAGLETISTYTNLGDPPLSETAMSTLAVSHPASGYINAQFDLQIHCAADTTIRAYLRFGSTNQCGTYYREVPTSNYYTISGNCTYPVTGSATQNVSFILQDVDNGCTAANLMSFNAIYVPTHY